MPAKTIAGFRMIPPPLDSCDGEAIFRHACALGLEGIVSKRRGCALQVRPQPHVAQDQEPGLRTMQD